MATDLLGAQNDTLTNMSGSNSNSDILSDGGLSSSSSTSPGETIATTMASIAMTAATNGHSNGIDSMPCFKDLFAVLFECFSIISLGYLSCRFKLISSEAKDLGSYLTTFALPMVIFLNIAQMEFETINVSFLFCMLFAKLFLFIIVTLLTLATSYPTNSGYAGALSILATQSNDFALGYPLIKSLYGERKPEMLNYLSLMAPIQLLILNPLGIVMLEYEKSKKRKSNHNNNNTICRACKSTSSTIANTTSLTTTPRVDQANDANNNNTNNDITNRSMSHEIHDDTKIADGDNKTEKHQNERRLSLADLSMPGHNSVNTRTASLVHHPLKSDATRRKGSKPLELDIHDRSISLDCGSETSIDTLGGADSDPNVNLVQFGTSPQSKVFHLPSPFECHPSPVVKSLVLKTRSTRPKLLYILPSQGEHDDRRLSSSHQNEDNEDLDDDDDDDHHSQPPQTNLEAIEQCTCKGNAKNPEIGTGFIKALATNPLIIASVVALIVNLINGPQLPKMVTKTANTIAASFAAPALFVVGLSMHGKFELILRSPRDLLLSSVLVVTKILLLPSIMRTLTQVILPHYVPAEEIPYLTDFSYLYGLLPTAPTACIIAKQYGVLTNVVSISMLLSTFISAPLMLGTSAIINQSTIKSPDSIQNTVAQVVKTSGSLTMGLSLITLFILWKVNKRISYVNFRNTPEVICRRIATRIRTNSTQLISILLVLTQLVIGIGGFMWIFVDTTKLINSPTATSIGRYSSHDEEMGMTSTTTSSSPVAAATTETSTNSWSELLSDSSSMDDDIIATKGFVPSLSEHMLPSRRGGLLMDPNAMALGFKALCTMQYIFSSGGLLMAKFVILSVVIFTVAQMFQANVMFSKLASLMMKIYPLLGVGTVVWLVFESSHLKCLPSEASLPMWPVSQYLRLLYNVLLLVIATPLLSIMFRSENKARHIGLVALHAASRRRHEVNGTQKPRLAKRRFLTSSASLSSDTSSAMTSNTNLDSSPTIGGQLNIQQSNNNNNNHHHHHHHHHHPLTAIDGSSNVVLDCNRLMEQNHSQPIVDKSIVFDDEQTTVVHNNIRFGEQNNIGTMNDGGRINHPNVLREPPNDTSDSEHNNDYCNNNNNHCNVVDNNDGNNVHISHLAAQQPQALAPPPAQSPTSRNQTTQMEFNKYSILIVFMLVQVVLNMTSIIQLLNQEKQYGTFRLIELANVALDFGQGLLTFLVLGLPSVKQI